MDKSAAEASPFLSLFAAETKRGLRVELGAVLSAPFGRLSVWTQDDHLFALSFEAPETAEKAPVSPMAQTVARQLQQWFSDPEFRFDIPLATRGTPFQNRVWQQIAAIPLRGRRTYGEIARDLHSAARAVGQACRANPFPIVIPCHRIVAQGGIGGFHGATDGHLIDTKKWLQDFETKPR